MSIHLISKLTKLLNYKKVSTPTLTIVSLWYACAIKLHEYQTDTHW